MCNVKLSFHALKTLNCYSTIAGYYIETGVSANPANQSCKPFNINDFISDSAIAG